jgi:hypothetical protein
MFRWGYLTSVTGRLMPQPASVTYRTLETLDARLSQAAARPCL